MTKNKFNTVTINVITTYEGASSVRVECQGKQVGNVCHTARQALVSASANTGYKRALTLCKRVVFFNDGMRTSVQMARIVKEIDKSTGAVLSAQLVYGQNVQVDYSVRDGDVEGLYPYLVRMAYLHGYGGVMVG